MTMPESNDRRPGRDIARPTYRLAMTRSKKIAGIGNTPGEVELKTAGRVLEVRRLLYF